MRLYIVSSAILALAALVTAQAAHFDSITAPAQAQVLTPGGSFDIT
jgi:hypothetical protein